MIRSPFVGANRLESSFLGRDSAIRRVVVGPGCVSALPGFFFLALSASHDLIIVIQLAESS
jgi:hypothetical protein